MGNIWQHNGVLKHKFLIVAFLTYILSTIPTMAADGAEELSAHWGKAFFMFAIVLLMGRIGDLVLRIGQPAVIGQLLMGMVISAIGYMGVDFMSSIVHEPSIAFLSAFGALLLLFSIGLESNLATMKTVGLNAFLVATIGVVAPFVLGTWVLGPIFFDHEGLPARLFIGASLVATSVGITASVFRALNIIRSRAAQTVLGAAVIDDVFGLIILAVVAAIASGNDPSARMIAELSLKAFGFLAIAIALGGLIAKPISEFFRRISGSDGMMVSVAVGFALVFGYLAEEFGLEPIIGAFAAGLILDAVHFAKYDDPEVVVSIRNVEMNDASVREQAVALVERIRHGQVEGLVGTLNHIFVPIFFVYTGMMIDIESLLKPHLYLIALVMTIVAVLGKLIAGIAAKGTTHEKLIVGVSMVPRGEVGLIFAATGKSLGVLSDDLFSVIIIVIVISTLMAPPLLRGMVKDSSTLPAA